MGVYTVTLTATGPGGSHTLTRTSYITVAGSGTAGAVTKYYYLGSTRASVRPAS